MVRSLVNGSYKFFLLGRSCENLGDELRSLIRPCIFSLGGVPLSITPHGPWLSSLGPLSPLTASEGGTGECAFPGADSFYSCICGYRIEGLGCFKGPRMIWIRCPGEVFFLRLPLEAWIQDHSFSAVFQWPGNWNQDIIFAAPTVHDT